jgi:hypothetical protein
LSEVFTGRLKDQMAHAITAYIAERRLLRLDNLQDGLRVWLKCLDTGKYVRVDSTGSLICDKAEPSTVVPSDTQFTIRKRHDRIALKSVLFNKIVSRANTRPLFRFAYLPVSILGPLETFTLSGDFLLVHSHLHPPKFLYISNAGEQVMPDGAFTKKNRFGFFLQVEVCNHISFHFIPFFFHVYF